MTRTLLCAATLLASASIAATAAARPMAPEDVAKIESLGELVVSPDGNRVAYTTARLPDVTAGEEDGTTKQQLKLAYGPDSAREFLPADMDVSSVRFSPDGRMVSFVHTDEDEKAAVWGIPVDGGGHRKLAAIEDADVRGYAWSPGGATLYLIAGAAPDEALDERKDAGFDAVVYEEEAKLNRLFRARVGEQIDAAPTAITVPGHVSAIQIAPGGTTAVIESAPSPRVDDSYTSKRVHVIDLARGRVLQVVETPGKLGDVEVSPDGRQISLIAGVDAHDPAETTLHLADVATGEYRALNAGAAEATTDAEFLSDGRLAAIVDIGTKSVLRIYSANGTMEREYETGGLILSDLEVGGDTIAVEAHSPQHPPELFVVTDGRFTRWTRHNPWLAQIDMGEQRPFTPTRRATGRRSKAC